MIVISDTSAITNLIRIGRLDLLEQMYGEILIPDAVLQELKAVEGHEEVLNGCNWISSRAPSDRKLITRLRKNLDLGESEAIALAIETEADYLVIDEQKGRNVANHLGILVIGLLGVLVNAKEAGLIPAVRPVAEELVLNGFHLSPKLIEAVLARVNE